MSVDFTRLKVANSTAPEDLLCYGFDASGLEAAPWAVVWPENTDEVVKAVKFASDNSVAITPRGAGTGMTGGAVPSKGGMVMSFERMNRIIEVDTENLNVLVEPGLINGELQRALEPRGFFYPPDPASLNFCTLGGNVAENAGGPRALKYGVTRDYVMELEAVLPGGEVITTGVRTEKGVVGYDLTRLLVGSEGTLAAITKIRLKCLPIPEDVATLLVTFGDLQSAGRAVSRIIASKIIPRTLEFMDSGAIAAVEEHKPAGLPRDAEALLLIELDGHPAAVREEAGRVAGICSALGADVRTAESALEKDRLWDARRSVSPALYHINPTKIGEDVVVPRSRIPDMLRTLTSLSERHGIKVVNFGHAGDGNIHVNIMVDRDDERLYPKALELLKDIFTAVLELGGTISGEHGVGLTKAEYIGMEIPPRELEIMKGIKKLFDPHNIMNPGKIFG